MAFELRIKTLLPFSFPRLVSLSIFLFSFWIREPGIDWSCMVSVYLPDWSGFGVTPTYPRVGLLKNHFLPFPFSHLLLDMPSGLDLDGLDWQNISLSRSRLVWFRLGLFPFPTYG